MSMVLAGSTGSRYYPNMQHLERTFLNKTEHSIFVGHGSPKTDKSMGEIAATEQTEAEGKVKALQKQSKMEATRKSKDVKGAY